MTDRNAKTDTSRKYAYARDCDGVWDTWEISDPDGEPLAFVRFWDSVGGEEKHTRDRARFIVHRLNRHDELLAALDGLLSIFDAEIASGVMWRDARIARARRAYARAAEPKHR